MKEKLKACKRYLIKPILGASIALVGCYTPSIDDVVLAKVHEPPEVSMLEGILFLKDHVVIDDEDFIFVLGKKYSKTKSDQEPIGNWTEINSIYVPEKLYSEVKVGDHFNPDWQYSLYDEHKYLDATKEMLFESSRNDIFNSIKKEKPQYKSFHNYEDKKK